MRSASASTTAAATTQFQGPIFIVGMQRSGTKLLRELLNGHSLISIPSVETNCLPYWVDSWSSYGDLSDPKQFLDFYNHVSQHPYFLYTKNQVGPIIDADIWQRTCANFTPAGVFEALIRHDATVDVESNKIWGDKSPAYINHLPLLKQLFPHCKIIHIVRDVRDYCLSLNHAWQKNMSRAAQRWTDNVMQATSSTQAFSQDYLEIKYETLLETPEVLLKQCCHFLGVEFEPSMLMLSKSPENIGATKGDTTIQSNNRQKYLTQMDKPTRESIESIAISALQHFNYETSYTGKPHRLSAMMMTIYKLLDGINFLRLEASREGLIKILKIELGAYITAR